MPTAGEHKSPKAAAAGIHGALNRRARENAKEGNEQGTPPRTPSPVPKDQSPKGTKKDNGWARG